MPRHCLPWVLAAAIAAIGFQLLQERVVRVPPETAAMRIAPPPIPAERVG
jgi:hypothetical protein